MKWTQLLSPIRVVSAAGLLACSFLGAARLASADEPAPGAATETIPILQARQAGDLDVVVRGQGNDRVKFTVTNKSERRLNVVLPPGLVASSTTGQGAAGGGGFQSMGLGAPTSREGQFGRYRSASSANTGFRSVPLEDADAEGIAISAGQTVEFTVPAVCLNFGIPTPTPRNTFTLMDVDDYTADPRARKALRSLSNLGTSHGVAQAVAWNVFNGLTFGQMAQTAAKYLNTNEISVAARFVEALDASGSHELVDPAYFQEGRILVRVQGEGLLSKDAYRLNSELERTRIFGLPVQVVENVDGARPSALLLNVVLTDSQPGQVRARVLVRHNSVISGWTRIGTVSLTENVAVSDLTGDALAHALDRALASSFVTATPARRSTGSTTLRIVNRLPFSIENVALRAGRSADAPTLNVDHLGIGPNRSGFVSIQAANGFVESIETNGL